MTNSQYDERQVIATLTMITYVLSHLSGAWHIHRYDDNISVLSSGIANEREALEIAIKAAKADRPSRVVRIASNGEYGVVATFVTEEL